MALPPAGLDDAAMQRSLIEPHRLGLLDKGWNYILLPCRNQPLCCVYLQEREEEEEEEEEDDEEEEEEFDTK